MISPHEMLADKGFFKLEDIYGRNRIREWNRIMDPLFEEVSTGKRSYVQGDELYQSGILGCLFDDGMKNLIFSLIPDPVFYHCHAFEISGGQKSTHIHDGHGLGWHRDEECGQFHSKDGANYISMFIYMTDVNSENGPFEILRKQPLRMLGVREKTLKVLGQSGTVFFFNRFFLHRANPNTSSIRRRVIKFSFQPRSLPNDRINLPEFQKLRALSLNGDPFIHCLASSDMKSASDASGLIGPAGWKSPNMLPDPDDNAEMNGLLRFKLEYNLKLMLKKPSQKPGESY